MQWCGGCSGNWRTPPEKVILTFELAGGQHRLKFDPIQLSRFHQGLIKKPFRIARLASSLFLMNPYTTNRANLYK
jgi:hypothetical protein